MDILMNEIEDINLKIFYFLERVYLFQKEIIESEFCAQDKLHKLTNNKLHEQERPLFLLVFQISKNI